MFFTFYVIMDTLRLIFSILDELDELALFQMNLDQTKWDQTKGRGDAEGAEEKDEEVTVQ